MASYRPIDPHQDLLLLLRSSFADPTYSLFIYLPLMPKQRAWIVDKLLST